MSQAVSSSVPNISPLKRSPSWGDAPSESQKKQSRKDAGEGNSPPRLILRLSESLSLPNDDLRASQELLSQLSVTPVIEKPLEARVFSVSRLGKRPTNEDVELNLNIEGIGVLACIFDGHGGIVVAQKVAQFFQERFPKKIKKDPDNAQAIITKLCRQFQVDCNITMGGTTALMCFYNLVSKKVTVGSLGDSRGMAIKKNEEEGFEYEWLNDEIDWTHPEAEKRVERAFGDPELFKTWKALPPKQRRYPHFPLQENRKGEMVARGVNCEGTLGDIWCLYKGVGALRRDPVFKEFIIRNNTLFLKACDGLWDIVISFAAVVEDVIQHHWEHKHLPEKLADYALEKGSTDNVTVMCIWIKVVGDPVFHNTQPSQPTPATQPFPSSED